MASNSSRGTLALPQFQQIQLKLDRGNYAFWRVLVQSAVRAHGFDDLISSTAVSPSPLLPSGSTGDMVPNPDFVTWLRRDQYLFSWMLSSISESMLGHVVRCRSSRELWSVLETVFRSQSKAQTMRYRKQLQNTKKGNLTVEDYFMKMRGIADQLAAIGKPFDDDELLMHIMEGFGPEYESLVVNTMQRSDAPDLQEIQLAFQAYEVRLAQQFHALTDHSAHVAYRGRGQPGGSGQPGAAVYGAGRGGQSGRGNRPNFGKMLVCQLCGRTGHVAIKCFKRFDIHFTGVDTPSPQPVFNPGSSSTTAGGNATSSPQAFMADYSGSVEGGAGVYSDHEGNWYVDSGATTHITNEFSNLAISSDYNGGESLMVGNGNVVPISAIGQGNSLDIVGGESN